MTYAAPLPSIGMLYDYPVALAAARPPTLPRYASAQRYLDKFGLSEATQMLIDEERLVTSELLVAAIAVASPAGGEWPGGSALADQIASLRALARLERQLTVSSSFMDGYLRAVVVLPLDPADANATTLEDCCLALARCGLADDSDNATDRMDECCKTWRAWLRDVATGKVQLITSAGGNVQPASTKIRTGTVRSALPWGSFGKIG